MSKPPKQITKAERDAHKAFRQVDAKKAMTEHEIAQKAFSNNRERLKAERLVREAAVATAPEKQSPQGEGKMTVPRPHQWTEVEVHRLRMLAKRKVSADSIAKSLGRYVGSVKTKARELNLIVSRKMKAKGK